MDQQKIEKRHDEKQINPYFIDFSSSLFLSGHFDWLEMIQKADIHTTNIKQISISHCGLHDKHVDLLLQFKWGCMNRLDFSFNNLSLTGISKLLNGLCVNRLTKLDLSSNTQIKSQGIKLLSRIKIPCLKILSLSQCNTQNSGARNFSKFYCPNLQIFNFYHNKIRLQGNNFLLNSFNSRIRDIKIWESYEQHELNSSMDNRICDYIVNMSMVVLESVDLIIRGGSGPILNRDIRFDMDSIYSNKFVAQS